MWILVVVAAIVAPALGWSLVATQALSPALAVHAALMMTAWGILLPAGGVVARYFKVTPRQNYPVEVENLFWWRWHRILQYSGVVLASIAFMIVVRLTHGRFATWHGRLGLVVMLTVWLQLLSPLFRGTKGGATDRRANPADPATWRGDHYDMTRRRRLFEAWHKPAGWIAIALAMVTMVLGVALTDAPAWLYGAVGAMQAALLLGLIDGRLNGRWVDTYHSLWGPDPVHPGNRVSAAPSRRPRWRSPR